MVRSQWTGVPRAGSAPSTIGVSSIARLAQGPGALEELYVGVVADRGVA